MRAVPYFLIGTKHRETDTELAENVNYIEHMALLDIWSGLWESPSRTTCVTYLMRYEYDAEY